MITLPAKTLDFLKNRVGQGSRNQELFNAACQLRDAGVSQNEAVDALVAKARDVDGLEESEARNTVLSAYRRRARDPIEKRDEKPKTRYTAPHKRDTPRRDYDLSTPENFPETIENEWEVFLRAAFTEGDGVCVCKARRNDEDEEFPPDAGVVLTREDWISKMKDRGAAGLFADSRKCGLYVRINPMPKGCKGLDSEVTNFRHVLVEFDTLPLDKQWSLLKQSGLPLSAVIHSGGRSIHGWVRVDAANRAEYDERRRIIYEHFERYQIDHKNGNPSRFSRFPGIPRGMGYQRLLAVNIGALTFEEWNDDVTLPPVRTPSYFLKYNTEQDVNNVLGNRWLCRGGSCLFIGQTGIGKSSLEMQAAVTWAFGDSFFGIRPDPIKKTLKSLIVQAENDDGDLAEELKGVVNGMGIHARCGELEERIKIVSDSEHCGADFVEMVRALVRRHQPDLVWFDPLLAYLGGDISSQEVTSKFLRNELNPLSQKYGFVWMIMHHTNKPPKDPAQRNSFIGGDFSYLGQGAAELSNWARSIVTVREVQDGLFELRMAKRGKRAGLIDNEDKPASPPVIHIQHGQKGIVWVRAKGPDDEKVQNVLSKLSFPMSRHDIMLLIQAEWGYSPKSIKQQQDKFNKIKIRCVQNGDMYAAR